MKNFNCNVFSIAFSKIVTLTCADIVIWKYYHIKKNIKNSFFLLPIIFLINQRNCNEFMNMNLIFKSSNNKTIFIKDGHIVNIIFLYLISLSQVEHTAESFLQ